MTERPLLLDGLAAPVVDRAAWGAEPAVDWPPERSAVRAIVVHHTATSNEEPEPLAMVRRVQRFHAHDRGWGDIGYSLIVLPDGRVAEGREGTLASPAPEVVQAGHAFGHNPGTVGIALAGRFHDRLPSEAAWATLVDVIATIAAHADLDPFGTEVVLANGRTLPAVISGHRDACATSCPGDAVADALEGLRYAVAERLAGSGAGSAGDRAARHRASSSANGPDAAQNAG
ncbi:MAG: N-acetylmuramoyl-L-alanine amidase [Acidimicrobiales bacterium]